MVANVDTIKSSTSLLTDNSLIPSFKMNIPQNLLHPIDLWTKEDVKKWFEYCIDEYSLGDINLNDFEMNGKALLLLNEDGFKQRSSRSGDILHKALQQHYSLIKSLTCQPFPYQLWNNFTLPPPPFIRHFNIPFPTSYIHPAFNYKLTNFSDPQQSNRIRQMSNSSSSSIIKTDTSIKQEYINEQIPNPSISTDEIDNTRQIRYYQDRIDFHGEILMKPQGAKNCRILWEFLYILLEDPHYETIIHWENREKMIFRIIQADKLAALWGLQKNRLSMTYEKLSRGMRYYYSNNIISKEQSKRLLYRFMRSPDEIRKNMKRNNNTSNMIYSTILPKSSPQINNEYLQLLSTYSTNVLNNHLFPIRNNSISKSDRSSSSSPESEDSDKQYFNSTSSTKRKQTIPISLTNRLSENYPIDQPLNLAVDKEENFLHYKKQKLMSYNLEQ